MHVYLREVGRARDTPNCVDCSRSIAHAMCSVLHLADDGWLIEQGLTRPSDRGEIEAQQPRGIREK
jgi:hypothetical protein